jgi:hypothetical protein
VCAALKSQNCIQKKQGASENYVIERPEVVQTVELIEKRTPYPLVSEFSLAESWIRF